MISDVIPIRAGNANYWYQVIHDEIANEHGCNLYDQNGDFLMDFDSEDEMRKWVEVNCPVSTMRDGSKVRIVNQQFIESLEINDCVGFEGEDDSCLPHVKELAKDVGVICDGYFYEYDDVWVKFGEELMIVVPKKYLKEEP